MVTFTINIPPMLAYIPYMDPMDILLKIKLIKTSVEDPDKFVMICHDKVTPLSLLMEAPYPPYPLIVSPSRS